MSIYNDIIKLSRYILTWRLFYIVILLTCIKWRHHSETLSEHYRRIVHVNKLLRESDDSYKINVDISDKIGPIRKISYNGCIYYKNYTSTLKISIILTIHNEALSVVLRTLESIRINTNVDNLKEIIIVDDKSTTLDFVSYDTLESNDKFKVLKESILFTKTQLDLLLGGDVSFESFLVHLHNVKFIRNKNRIGLIKSRIVGADAAKGDVLVFMDAHIECLMGWEKPILHVIEFNPTMIVQPTVDEISPITLEYQIMNPYMLTGGISWDLRYVWMEPMKTRYLNRLMQKHKQFNDTLIPTLSIVGCTFAVNRQHFFDIGGFDGYMNIWGGENIEISLKNWLSGNEVMTNACSHVGHIFKDFSYSFNGNKLEIIQKNVNIIAEIYMDEWNKYFYAVTQYKHGEINKKIQNDINYKNYIRNQKIFINLRKIHNFDWLYRNFIPNYPIPQQYMVLFGEVFTLNSKTCLDLSSEQIYFSNCFHHRLQTESYFYLTNDGYFCIYQNQKCLMYDGMNEHFVFTSNEPDETVMFNIYKWKSTVIEYSQNSPIVTIHPIGKF
ncbi:hypothetical protein A3Q56_02314 [Intoshia linei]|uniref:Polypeptide N-acetylgalactosaminyltransferase n=1 Tax=Intoshia linei TaxID=1819745 RepID=A0A177B8T4_9BILA|nr:hypothetical protein A3Q56_02314 [Intoshia linei]